MAIADNECVAFSRRIHGVFVDVQSRGHRETWAGAVTGNSPCGYSIDISTLTAVRRIAQRLRAALDMVEGAGALRGRTQAGLPPRPPRSANRPLSRSCELRMEKRWRLAPQGGAVVDQPPVRFYALANHPGACRRPNPEVGSATCDHISNLASDDDDFVLPDELDSRSTARHRPVSRSCAARANRGSAKSTTMRNRALRPPIRWKPRCVRFPRSERGPLHRGGPTRTCSHTTT